MKRRSLLFVAIALMAMAAFVPPVLAQVQKTPFSASIKVDMNPGEFHESAVFVKVPPDKRLTIQFVSVKAPVPIKQEAAFSIEADSPDFIPLTFQGIFFHEDDSNGKSVYVANQAVLVFASPGREVVGVFRRTKGAGQTGEMIASIFGFLEDVSPAPQVLP